VFMPLNEQEVAGIIDFMVDQDIFWDDNGILWFGQKGEEKYGRRNFMDLLSVITSEPLFAVRHGRNELGFVHQLSFAAGDGNRTVLSLGGRSWAVNHLDWKRKVAYVEPTRQPGRSRWLGGGQPLSFEIAQSIRNVLASDRVTDRWSRRATSQVKSLREKAPWAQEGSTAVVSTDETTIWWTFGGAKANAAIAARFRELGCRGVDHDSLSVTIGVSSSPEHLHSCVESICRCVPGEFRVPVLDEAFEELKFSTCLPRDRGMQVLESRLSDYDALERLFLEPVRYVRAN
jgi:ATP-dependent Lhr-like helicase